MSITDQENTLFAAWLGVHRGFVADGVIDEQAYLASSPKLLFVLKEVNDPDGGGWDLREFLRDGGRPQTWDNVTRWVEGIRDLSRDVPWAELVLVENERRREALRSIAVLNLKKSPGGHTTDTVELATIAAEDRVFLKRQFSLYEPDLIVCCGSPASDVFHWLVDLGMDPDWRTTSRGVEYHEYSPGKYVIRYAHPEARVADSLLYYGLIDAVRIIFSKGKYDN